MLAAETKTKSSPDVSDCVTEMVDEGRRRWDNLAVECLVNVFSRLGMESLVLGVAFVCKSWYAASLDSCLWKFLYFPEFEPYPIFTKPDDDEFDPKSFGDFYDKFVQLYGIDRTRFSITGFVKLIVSRSKGEAVELHLPQFCTEEAYRYVADACPVVRVLSFPDDLQLFQHGRTILQVIRKCKLLEHLTLGGNMKNIWRQRGMVSEENYNITIHFQGVWSLSLKYDDQFDVDEALSEPDLNEILVEIGINCKHFRSLHIFDIEVGEADALTAVSVLPNLQELKLENCYIRRDSLLALLLGCKKLCCFHLLNCKDFEESDEQVRKLAAHMSDFQCMAYEYGYISFEGLRVSLFIKLRLIKLLTIKVKELLEVMSCLV